MSGTFPWLVAHRGAMIDAPENTRSAFNKALAYPIDGIELDVQVTRDKIPVIYHDETLEKINGNKHTISEVLFEELETIDFGHWFSTAYRGEKILTLDDVLLTYGSKTRLLVEIKPPPRKEMQQLYHELAISVPGKIRDLVPANDLNNIFILSFDPDILKTAYIHDSGLHYVLNIDSPIFFENECNIDIGILFGCCLAFEKMTSEFTKFCRYYNKRILTYSCNTIDMIDAALEMQVDVIMTDDPGQTGDYFQEINDI